MQILMFFQYSERIFLNQLDWKLIAHYSNKSENSDWERVILNLKKDDAKIIKNLFFSNNVMYTFQ